MNISNGTNEILSGYLTDI